MLGQLSEAPVRGTVGEDFEERKTCYGTRAGLFNLNAIDFLGQFILCSWGLSSALQSISDLYFLNVRVIPMLWKCVSCPNIAKYLLGGKIHSPPLHLKTPGQVCKVEKLEKKEGK